MTSLASTVRATLLSSPEVSRLVSLRRSSSLYSQNQPAQAFFFVEEGLIKITRKNQETDRVILAIVGPDQLLGDEALAQEAIDYQCDAEILTTATVWRIPRDLLFSTLRENPEFSSLLLDHLLQHKLTLARKVELLCLHNVEYRILYYLAELSTLVKPSDPSGSHQFPLTQAELADMIGATRETTSTTLNQLERRGLVRLSRRLVTVPSLSEVHEAIHLSESSALPNVVADERTNILAAGGSA